MIPEPLVVIGIGAAGADSLSRDALERVAQASTLAGGRRHLSYFPEFAGETLVIDANLTALAGNLRASRARGKTVVLASGDPLYFGIGRFLLEAFPKEELVFLPHCSAVQLAFAHLKETWNDATIVSLHGRPLTNLSTFLEAGATKLALLTDAVNDPATIADFLNILGRGEDFDLWVCEDLGGPEQRVTQWTTKTIQGEVFSPLNIVVLLARRPTLPDPKHPLLGIPDDAFLHRDDLITKTEIRLVALGYLELHADNVLWDIGAGSGSVALEAAGLSASLKILAIEKNEAAFAQLQANIHSLGRSNVQAIFGEAPQVLASLPAPDAVFVGGSAGHLVEILAAAVERLPSGGRIVMNCITIESFYRGWECLARFGLAPRATSVQVSRTRPLGSLHRFEPDSTITIIRGRKP